MQAKHVLLSLSQIELFLQMQVNWVKLKTKFVDAHSQMNPLDAPV
jgi:hypothetical protein